MGWLIVLLLLKVLRTLGTTGRPIARQVIAGTGVRGAGRSVGVAVGIDVSSWRLLVVFRAGGGFIVGSSPNFTIHDERIKTRPFTLKLSRSKTERKMGN